MKIPVTETKKIEDGMHEGAIIDVKYRTTPQGYKYTDFIIDMDGLTMKAGYPTSITLDNGLGLLFQRFGLTVSKGLELDPDELIGRAVEFITLKQGKFSNILPESLKPQQPHIIVQTTKETTNTIPPQMPGSQPQPKPEGYIE